MIYMLMIGILIDFFKNTEFHTAIGCMHWVHAQSKCIYSYIEAIDLVVGSYMRPQSKCIMQSKCKYSYIEAINLAVGFDVQPLRVVYMLDLLLLASTLFPMSFALSLCLILALVLDGTVLREGAC